MTEKNSKNEQKTKPILTRFPIKSPRPNTAVLLLHGLPAFNCRNEYIAQHLQNDGMADSFILHYRGLEPMRESNYFSVSLAIADTKDLISQIALDYSNIAVIGHSFGAMVGLVAVSELVGASSLNISFVLLAPLLEVPSNEVCSQIIEEVNAMPETKDRSIDPETVLKELAEIRDQYSLLQDQIFKKFPALIVLATHDEVLPSANSARAKVLLPIGNDLIELPDDHVFSKSRQSLPSLISTWLKQRTSNL